MNLEMLSEEELMASTDRAVRVEKEAIVLTTRHFQEVYRRRSYLPEYFDMVDFLMRRYGYCVGSAQLRIGALKLIRQVPSVQEKIETGEISMTVAANIQTFLNAEAKAKRPYSENAKIELVDACTGKSKLEAQKEFARRNPEFEKRESVRYVSQDRVRIEVSISEKTLENLNRLRELFSHVDRSMSLGSLIDRLADEAIEKHCPRKKAERAKNRAEKKSSARNAAKFALSADQAVRAESAVTAQKSENLVHPDEPESSSQLVHTVELTNSSRSVHPDEPANSSQLVHPDEPPKKRTRYTPASERHRVHDDGQGCTFVDLRSGRRCGSRKFLQLDHVIPFARGGSNTAENLRWMCAQHNRFRSGSVRFRR